MFGRNQIAWIFLYNHVRTYDDHDGWHGSNTVMVYDENLGRFLSKNIPVHVSSGAYMHMCMSVCVMVLLGVFVLAFCVPVLLNESS